MNTSALARADRWLRRAEARRFRWWTLDAQRGRHTEATTRAWRRYCAAWWTACNLYREAGEG
jgi:hypothetical protein